VAVSRTGRGQPCRWIALLGVVIVLALAGTACSAAVLGGDAPRNVADNVADNTEPTVTSAEPDAGGAGAGSGSGTRLERSRSDAASDIERRVSETLSELDAEVRGGDTVITLPDRVLFDFDQHELLSSSTEILDDIAEAIVYFADAPVRVAGHTDGKGSPEYNQGLSERRARSVVDHLVTAGVEARRVTAEGLGEANPVAADTNPDGSDNPQGRAQNRRVEIVIEGVDPTRIGN
jgi:outer membrane protein OmpA-like peptidoglycan-associated protein